KERGMIRHRLTRRDLVRAVSVGVVGAGVTQLIAACGSAPSPTAAPAAKPTEAPKPAAPAAAAPAPTAAAPAAAAAAPTTAAPVAAKPATSAKALTLNWFTPAEIGLERDFYNGFI